MWKILCSIFVAVAVVAAVARAGAEPGGEDATVSGEIVDLACYVPRGDKGRGSAHQECAEMCAKGGQPLGVLSADGSLILLVEDHAKPAPYGAVKKLAGQTAQISGKKFARNGLSVLVVTKVEAQ